MKRSFFFSLLLATTTIFASCNNEAKDPILGKYVYEDDSEVLHIDEECSNLISKRNKRGHLIYAKTPIDTTEIMCVEQVCSKCVNDATYEHLKAVCMRNKEIDYDRKWLYNKLKWTGYDMEDYELFIYHIANKQKRQRLYTTAQKEGWNVGTFEEFSTLLGF